MYSLGIKPVYTSIFFCLSSAKKTLAWSNTSSASVVSMPCVVVSGHILKHLRTRSSKFYGENTYMVDNGKKSDITGSPSYLLSQRLPVSKVCAVETRHIDDRHVVGF